MIQLHVIDFKRSCCAGFHIYVNPSCIEMVKDGTTDIFGRHYVKVILSPHIMNVLPLCDCYVAVEGTLDEIVGQINELEKRDEIVVKINEQEKHKEGEQK